MTDVPVTVLVLNWNGLKDTIACVDSLLAGSLGSARIAIVDNGSDGNDAAKLRAKYGAHASVSVFENQHNLGFTRGVNDFVERWLDHRQEGWLALLNNDTVVQPDWLSQLLACAARTGADVVASCMIRYDDHDRLDNAGHIMLSTGEILPRGVDRRPAGYAESTEVLGACAGAALYSLPMLNDVGLFDEFFDTGYEDAELGLRVVLAGYRVVYEPLAQVYHHGSRSLDKVRDFDYAVGIQRNINYTMVKLLPWQLLLINLPFIAGKQLAILLVALLTLRWRLFKAHVQALLLTVRQRKLMFSARRQAASLRRIHWTSLLVKQEFFLRHYLSYFWKYIVLGNRTVFER